VQGLSFGIAVNNSDRVELIAEKIIQVSAVVFEERHATWPLGGLT
jgi:hypothetical protein